MKNDRNDMLDFVRRRFCAELGLTADEVAVCMDEAGNIAIVCNPRAPMKTATMTVQYQAPGEVPGDA